MSTLTVLKEYLVGKDGYLLNDDNNGKTVMLSGAWGSGKTHFWQNEIEEDLTKTLNKKDKACVYVSLYGKDNIEAIKNEILFKAYESIKDENKLAKRAISAFGFGSRLLSVSVGGVRANTGVVGDAVEGFFESKKIDEAESFLADGGLICLDDFERKSKHIDLNDLFGFIAQLAIDMNCKIVIILNSDVFEGDEANVFKTVKEKTVNKFFYFEPTIEELFNSIYDSHEKYKILDVYKTEILNAMKQTEELNARIYIQVLDNCLEWLTVKESIDRNIIQVLVLGTFNFALNHLILDYMPTQYPDKNSYGNGERYQFNYKEINFTAKGLNGYFRNLNIRFDARDKEFNFSAISPRVREEVFMDFLVNKGIDKEYLEKYKKRIEGLWKYGYRLYYIDRVDSTIYNEIAQFIKSGILLRETKEPSS